MARASSLGVAGMLHGKTQHAKVPAVISHVLKHAAIYKILYLIALSFQEKSFNSRNDHEKA